jgi:hypothetical protein
MRRGLLQYYSQKFHVSPKVVSIYLLISCCSHLEHGASMKLFVSRQSLGLHGRVISPTQSRYLHRTIQTQNKRRHLWLEWDSNPRSQVRAGEDISCLRPRGHCDRLQSIHCFVNITWFSEYTSTLHTYSSLRYSPESVCAILRYVDQLPGNNCERNSYRIAVTE